MKRDGHDIKKVPIVVIVGAPITDYPCRVLGLVLVVEAQTTRKER